MNVLLREVLALSVLVIISDGIGAAMAARAMWRLRKKPKARPLAIPLMTFMGALALIDLSDAVNAIANGSCRTSVDLALIQSLVGRIIRSAATWYLALKLMNGYSSDSPAEQTEDNANIAK